MSSPEKKTMEKPSLMPGSTPNPSLPDDLLVSCLARVSKLYYPTLSLVSKSFRSLLASPEFYKIRSSLGKTESCLYVCLRINSYLGSWFTLCRKPDKSLTNGTLEKKSSGYVLVAIPNPHRHYLEVNVKGMVALGSNIYTIGGPIEDERSSSVSIMDCRSNTWHEAPRMRVERKYASANILDGKIYVAGGCKKCDSSNWMEVFDPEKQAWELVSGPGAEVCDDGYVEKSAAIDGKIIYIFVLGNYKSLTYKPREGNWEKVGWEMDSGWVQMTYCVIENVVYCYDKGEFKWYDTKVRLWRNLKTVKELPRFAPYSIRLADYGGKMAVLWEESLGVIRWKEKMICCAVIALERRNSEEVWGDVEWHGEVLTVSAFSFLECALTVTV